MAIAITKSRIQTNNYRLILLYIKVYSKSEYSFAVKTLQGRARGCGHSVRTEPKRAGPAQRELSGTSEAATSKSSPDYTKPNDNLLRLLARQAKQPTLHVKVDPTVICKGIYVIFLGERLKFLTPFPQGPAFCLVV